MKEQAVRVGVIGAGVMGEIHATNVARHIKGAELVALADPNLERASALAAELGKPAVYAKGLDLIQAPDVDAVVVASTDATHATYTLACLEAAKPVLCEKPLAISAVDALEIVKAERRLGRRMVHVGFMRQFDRAHVEVRRAVEEGRIGQPVMFRGVHVNRTIDGARVSPEDAVYGAVIHDVHSARFLMGQEIDTVYVIHAGMELSDRSSCRILAVSLAFADGSVGLVDVNLESGYGYVVSAEVVGTNATAMTVHPTHSAVLRSGERRENLTTSFQGRFQQAYLDEATSWLQGLRSGEPSGPSAWDGYAATAVADACCESIRTGLPVSPILVDRPDSAATSWSEASQVQA